MQRAGSVDSMYSLLPLPATVKLRTRYSRPPWRYPSLSTFVSPSGSSGSFTSSSITVAILPSLSNGTWLTRFCPPRLRQRPPPKRPPRNPPRPRLGVPASDAGRPSTSDPSPSCGRGVRGGRPARPRLEGPMGVADLRAERERVGTSRSGAGVDASSSPSASSASLGS